MLCLYENYDAIQKVVDSNVLEEAIKKSIMIWY